MARPRTIHRCADCGASSSRWVGRCATCGAWNSLVEEAQALSGSGKGPVAPGATGPAPVRSAGGDRPVLLRQVDGGGVVPMSTGVAEMDRVLDGGLVPGSVTLVAGEPGIGKSTLLLQALGAMAARGLRGLLVSGEESKAQVQARARRLGTLAETLWVVSETCLPDILAAVAEVEPHVCVVDSVQTLYDPGLESPPGSVAQVRHCAQRLVESAKTADGPAGCTGTATAVVLVGHVTKEGAIAGPRVLEHVVDTVLSFEGDRHHGLRLLRAVKHRFGPTGDLGLFEMTGTGLAPVSDPSAYLLGDRRPGVPGCLVLPAMEGGRPLLVEVQALVVPAPNSSNARRSTQGLEGGRLPLLLAVLERRAGVRLADMEVYASVVGGVRVTEPAADLALVMSLASAWAGQAMPEDAVAFGEVGLGGEVRQVAHAQRRLAEAARLGFRRAVVPASVTDAPPGIRLIGAPTVMDAVGLIVSG